MLLFDAAFSGLAALLYPLAQVLSCVAVNLPIGGFLSCFFPFLNVLCSVFFRYVSDL